MEEILKNLTYSQIIKIFGGVKNKKNASKVRVTIGYSHLYNQTILGNIKYVYQLLVVGKNPNGFGKGGLLPLIIAINLDNNKGNHYEIVKILISYGADLDLEDICGRTPLGEMLRLWPKEKISSLLQEVENVYTVSSKGKTLLHIAAQIGCRNSIIDLLNKSVNPDFGDKNNMTALDYAFRYNNIDKCDILIYEGVDINLERKGIWGLTPLEFICNRGKLNILKTLIRIIPLEVKKGIKNAIEKGRSLVSMSKSSRVKNLLSDFMTFDKKLSRLNEEFISGNYKLGHDKEVMSIYSELSQRSVKFMEISEVQV